MPDYTQFNSTNNAYSFSKGPKSIYYGQGDDQLMGVVLNVPQSDADDEWGGTERIAWERVVDQLSQLMVEVEDPYESGTGGLINRVNLILGVPGGAAGFIDASVPSLTMGSVVVNGALNSVLIGTGGELTETSLELGTDFRISSGADYYSLNYRGVQLRLRNDLLSTRRFDFLICGATAMRISNSGVDIGVPLALTSSLSAGSVTFTDITVSGTSSLQGSLYVGGSSEIGNIDPRNDGGDYDIGSGGKPYRNIQAQNFIVGSTFPTPDAGSLLPLSGLTTVDIGSLTDRFNVLYSQSINVNSIYQGNYDQTVRLCGYVIMHNNVLLDKNITASSLNVNSLNSNLGSSIGVLATLSTVAVAPLSNNAYDLGTSALRYQDVYCETLNANNIYQGSTSGSVRLCGYVNMHDNLSVDKAIVANSLYLNSLLPNLGSSIGVQATLSTSALTPMSNNTYDVGSAVLRYQDMFAVNLNLTGVLTTATISAASSTISITNSIITRNIFPESNNSYTLGSNASGFVQIYLADQANPSVIKRLFICGANIVAL